MALNRKLHESELEEHSADLTFEVYTSDIKQYGGYTDSLNRLASLIEDEGLQVTGDKDENGVKMIITASTPEQCSALESLLTDEGLDADFIDYVMNNPLQHDGMDYQQAQDAEDDVIDDIEDDIIEETFENVKSPYLRKKILESAKGDGCGCGPLNEGFSKKQREELAEQGLAMKDGSFPIRNKKDLKNAIQSIGRAKDEEKAKRWIKKRAKELNALDMLPEEWLGSKKKVNESEEVEAAMEFIHNDWYGGSTIIPFDLNDAEIVELETYANELLSNEGREDQKVEIIRNEDGVVELIDYSVNESAKFKFKEKSNDIWKEDGLWYARYGTQVSSGSETKGPVKEWLDAKIESDRKKQERDFAKLNESKSDKQPVSPFGKVKVNGKKLCECGKGELRQMLREAKKELTDLKKKEKSLAEGTSKRERNKLGTSIKKAEKLCEILEEEIKFNPNKSGAVNEARTLWNEFTKWAKLYEAEEENSEEDEETPEDTEDTQEEDSKKEDDAEEADLEAIVLTVKDTEKVKQNLIDAGIPEEHIEVIPDNEEDEESKEGKLRVDADDAITLKDYLAGLGIDLEEEIGAEIIDDSEKNEEEPEEKEDDDSIDDSKIEATAEDIFGEE